MLLTDITITKYFSLFNQLTGNFVQVNLQYLLIMKVV